MLAGTGPTGPWAATLGKGAVSGLRSATRCDAAGALATAAAAVTRSLDAGTEFAADEATGAGVLALMPFAGGVGIGVRTGTGRSALGLTTCPAPLAGCTTCEMPPETVVPTVSTMSDAAFETP
jgi:hypothetical protein